VLEKLATYEFSVEGASSEAVAKAIADPKTWVTLMGMPEETVPDLLGSGSDFKCVRDDGKTCYMTNVVSKDGDREGDKVFAYTTSLTHTDLGDAGLAAPIFTVKHEFTMSPSSKGCVVKRVCTDFEQNQMLEVDLGSMLQGGMIAQENATLVTLCTKPPGRLVEQEESSAPSVQPAASNVRVFFLHGSWPRVPISWSHSWDSQMKEALEQTGATVIADANPPGSDIPPEGQIKHLADLVGEPDENTFFVAFSMGNHVTMRYLQSLAEQSKKVGGWVAVAGWFESVGGIRLPNQEIFLPMRDRTTIDGAKVNAVCPRITLINGPKDPVHPLVPLNIHQWKDKFGGELKVFVHDFIKDSTDDGTQFGGGPAYLWKDHLFGLDSVDASVVNAACATILPAQFDFPESSASLPEATAEQLAAALVNDSHAAAKAVGGTMSCPVPEASLESEPEPQVSSEA
jgi:predicted alpha/beta hydrolase family esterase